MARHVHGRGSIVSTPHPRSVNDGVERARKSFVRRRTEGAFDESTAFEARVVFAARSRSDEGVNLVAPRQKCARGVAADESRCGGDEDPHAKTLARDALAAGAM